MKKDSEATTDTNVNENDNAMPLSQIYTQQIMQDYKEPIFRQLSEYENDLEGFLTGHSISTSLRAKMIDWMI